MTTDDGDGLRIIVRGQLDLSTGERLEQALAEAERRANGGGITLDYSGLEFLDSTGLQILLDADVRASRDGHRIAVVLGHGEARRVAELADVVDRLTVAEV